MLLVKIPHESLFPPGLHLEGYPGFALHPAFWLSSPWILLTSFRSGYAERTLSVVCENSRVDEISPQLRQRTSLTRSHYASTRLAIRTLSCENNPKGHNGHDELLSCRGNLPSK